MVERMEDTVRALSQKQLVEMISRFVNNTNWGQLEQDQTQRNVIELSPAEFGRRMTVFIKNGCRFEIKGPSFLTIDRTTRFDPSAFIDEGWSIAGEDERALLVTSIDLSKVDFESGLMEDEKTISGTSKLERLKAGGKIRLDAKIAQTLLEEEGWATLRFLYNTYGIESLEFAGTVLRHKNGNLFFLCVRRKEDGSWYRYSQWHDFGRDDTFVSPLLSSDQIF